MKIEVNKVSTSIECTSDELRQSNTLSDGLTNTLRALFNGPTGPVYANDEEDNTDED